METKLSLMHCILPLLITGVPLLIFSFKILLSTQPPKVLLISSKVLLTLFNLYGWTVFIVFGYLRDGTIFYSFRESLFFVALLISTLQMVGNWFASTQKNSLFSLTLSMSILCSALILPEKYYTGEINTAWFTLHLLFSLCAYAFFAVSAALSFMYMTLDKKLKAKKFDSLFQNLPPLNTLESYSTLWMGLGVVFSAFSLIAIYFWVSNTSSSETISISKLSILIPIMCFIGILIGKVKKKFSGLTQAKIILSTFALLAIIQVLQSIL